MTPRLVFRPEARAEVREAREWYEAQSPGLGLEFARAVEAVLATISRTPAFFPVVEGATRRALAALPVPDPLRGYDQRDPRNLLLPSPARSPGLA